MGLEQTLKELPSGSKDIKETSPRDLTYCRAGLPYSAYTQAPEDLSAIWNQARGRTTLPPVSLEDPAQGFVPLSFSEHALPMMGRILAYWTPFLGLLSEAYYTGVLGRLAYSEHHFGRNARGMVILEPRNPASTLCWLVYQVAATGLLAGFLGSSSHDGT
ncbi:MAG: hypothetical protein Q7S65_05545 [Nanoarchaeota archaeon]|nr:hypothetical protein [Nanoarchaeota archaeon]